MFYTNNVYKKNFTYEGLIKRIINPVNLKQNNREFKNWEISSFFYDPVPLFGGFGQNDPFAEMIHMKWS